MTQKKLYLILQSVLCVLLVILLAASAVSIYREGVARKAEDPMAWIYTRETAAEKFKPIAPLFFGAIGLTVAGWILGVKDENAGKPVKDVEILRNLTVARVVTPSEAMKAEQEKQRKLFLSGWALFALCMVPIAVYVLNGAHFPDGDLEGMIAALAARVIPLTVLGLGCLMVSTHLQEKSILRETEAAKEQLKAEKEAGVEAEPKPPAPAKSTINKRRLQMIVAIAAVVFIILGVLNGSAKAVHTKAANICTECVGLG